MDSKETPSSDKNPSKPLLDKWHYWTKDETNPHRWEHQSFSKRVRWAVFLFLYFASGMALLGWVSVRITKQPLMWEVVAADTLVLAFMFVGFVINPRWMQRRKLLVGVAFSVITFFRTLGVLVWADYR